MLASTWWGSIGLNLAASAIFALLLWIRRATYPLSRRDPRLALIPLGILTLFATAGIYTSLVATADGTLGIVAAAALTTISILAVCVGFGGAGRRLWQVGIRGADLSVAKGLDYGRALGLCQNEISFIGTSARKLTSHKVFERTIKRCRPDQPLRFLLMEPTDNNLRAAAQRSGRDPDEYTRTAHESLRTLAGLHKNGGVHNLEVRFYDTDTFEPIFRLMFIDRSICLASYNVYGEGDGSQLPQLHIAKAKRNTRSFYYAFDLYFDQIWERSVPWVAGEFLS